MQLFNLFKVKLNRNRKPSYMKLTNCVNPCITHVALAKLNIEAFGYELEEAFELSGISLRFGTAKIDNKIENIILIDLKASEYERSRGRYTVYKFSKQNQLNYISGVDRVYRYLPNHWKENTQYLCDKFV